MVRCLLFVSLIERLVGFSQCCLVGGLVVCLVDYSIACLVV